MVGPGLPVRIPPPGRLPATPFEGVGQGQLPHALQQLEINDDSLRRWGEHAKGANQHNLEHDRPTKEANTRGLKNHLWMERVTGR
jgi:hypothetical protein